MYTIYLGQIRATMLCSHGHLLIMASGAFPPYSLQRLEVCAFSFSKCCSFWKAAQLIPKNFQHIFWIFTQEERPDRAFPIDKGSKRISNPREAKLFFILQKVPPCWHPDYLSTQKGSTEHQDAFLTGNLGWSGTHTARRNSYCSQLCVCFCWAER